MRRTRLAATLTVAAVALLGCSSGGDSDDVTSAPTAASSPYVIANGSVPKRPLIPSNTYEAGGVRIVSNVFAGLVYYDADGRPQQEMATSISTPDNLTWTVILEPGWTFSDGSPVTPTSYVKAWDWAATASNGQINAYYFEPIIGFSYTEDSSLIAAGGLEAREDENIIKIHLSQPIADFPARLGYHAFYPLPEAAYADMASYGAHPIGNGPYLIGDATADGTDGTDGADRADEAGTDETDSAANATASADNTILLTPNPDYTGPRKAANKGIEIVAYDNLDDAYTDLRSGRLDILATLPAEAINTFA
ncbi:MAG: ABC transporter substrate-binding protein, partial [Cellulomonadaceae bacterium]|nr:ABC transporter substrate-binding protein [Cellulomonadaceae bacterium]